MNRFIYNVTISHGYTIVSFLEGDWKSNLWITYHPSALSSVVRKLKQAGPLKSGISLLFLLHPRCVLCWWTGSVGTCWKVTSWSSLEVVYSLLFILMCKQTFNILIQIEFIWSTEPILQ
jgi:hypothetical protein